jgi:hypothetical protein
MVVVGGVVREKAIKLYNLCAESGGGENGSFSVSSVI